MYREAASRGSRDALFHLGYMFWHGLGTKRNRKQVTCCYVGIQAPL